MSVPEVRTHFVNLGYDIFPPMTPEQFAARLNAEVQKWAKVVRDFNVKAD
jgi:tripartite-type tricarboxylate transporter receptor subunit TctC